MFERGRARHVFVWIGVFGLLFILDKMEFGPVHAAAKALVYVSFYMVLVYFNLYYLIPNYLSQKTIFTYLGLMVLSVVILTPIMSIALYFLYSNAPIYQENIIFNQHNIFLFNLFVIGSSSIVKILNDWLKHERDKKELETQTMQSELKFLKSQINPHFLFNTLNSLYALTLKKSDSAPEIVIKLSEMMRYMLYECNERNVPLRKEVQYIQNYLDLERLRQGNHVQIDFDLHGQIKDQQIAPLMFMPFLENSFKHGLNNQITDGFVKIKLQVDQNKVDLNIENSKPTTKPVQNHAKPSGGIGLVNVRRRLDLIYPKQYHLNVRDNPNTYQVQLKLDLTK